MIVSLLTGRKGSKGFRDKHFYKILGEPVAYFPMRAARKCDSIDKKYISTDDENLMRLAKKIILRLLKGHHIFALIRPFQKMFLLMDIILYKSVIRVNL